MTSRIAPRPVIGILTVPFGGDQSWEPGMPKLNHHHRFYTQSLEAVGALTVPIHYNAPRSEVLEMVDKVNGVVFTGGILEFVEAETGELTPYAVTAKLIFDRARELNEQGVHFPILGVCMGFHFFNFVIEGRPNLKRTDSQVISDFLTYEEIPLKSTKWLKEIPQELLEASKTEKVTVNFHSWSVLTEDFKEEASPLNKFYDLIATTEDRKGVSYVAMIEAKQYPFYATQFHPEKTAHDHRWEVTPHWESAIDFSQGLLGQFVEDALQNTHSFGSYEELVRHLTETVGKVRITIERDGSISEDKYVFETHY